MRAGKVARDLAMVLGHPLGAGAGRGMRSPGSLLARVFRSLALSPKMVSAASDGPVRTDIWSPPFRVGVWPARRSSRLGLAGQTQPRRAGRPAGVVRLPDTPGCAPRRRANGPGVRLGGSPVSQACSTPGPLRVLAGHQACLWSCGPPTMLFTTRAPMASGFMVAWWEVRRAGPLGRWWAVTASWLGSWCCWMMPWRVAAVWCCARVRRGSGRPGWRRRPPRRPPRGACRWRGPGGRPGQPAAVWPVAAGAG